MNDSENKIEQSCSEVEKKSVFHSICWFCDDDIENHPYLQLVMEYVTYFFAATPAMMFSYFWFVKIFVFLHPELIGLREFASGEFANEMHYFPFVGPIGLLIAPTTSEITKEKKALLFVASVGLLFIGYSTSRRLGFF